MQLITGRVTGQQPVDNRFKVYAWGVLQLLFSGQSSSQSFRLPRGQRFLAVNKSIDENNPLHSIDYDFQRISPGIAQLDHFISALLTEKEKCAKVLRTQYVSTRTYQLAKGAKRSKYLFLEFNTDLKITIAHLVFSHNGIEHDLQIQLANLNSNWEKFLFDRHRTTFYSFYSKWHRKNFIRFFLIPLLNGSCAIV